MIVSRLKNKLQETMSNFLPDSMVADKLKNQQAPARGSEEENE